MSEQKGKRIHPQVEIDQGVQLRGGDHAGGDTEIGRQDPQRLAGQIGLSDGAIVSLDGEYRHVEPVGVELFNQADEKA